MEILNKRKSLIKKQVLKYTMLIVNNILVIEIVKKYNNMIIGAKNKNITLSNNKERNTTILERSFMKKTTPKKYIIKIFN